MHKLISILGLCLITTQSFALTSQPFQDNADVTAVLSKSNFNRLVVRGDKITKAYYPQGFLEIQGLSQGDSKRAIEEVEIEEPDGSLYVMVTHDSPFTLFITTLSGHHFSATIESEESLGKTIEFVPKNTVVTQKSLPANVAPKSQKPPYADAIANLMTQMVRGDNPKGFESKRHFGKVIKLQNNLKLIPKRTFTGIELIGEVMELYNPAKYPTDIREDWFADKDVKAVSLSTQTLLPRQSAFVYRVLERENDK